MKWDIIRMEYSVLMSVYGKENPHYLKESIESMLNQTVKTNDFVIVCDGPLTKELDDILSEYSWKYPNLIKIYRLIENKGLGLALSFGLKYCKNNIVARMDSDDISLPNRCELQLDVLIKDKTVSIISGWVGEFSDDINKFETVHAVPEYNVEILKYARMRCPFNHPCVMFKKDAVLSVGSYVDFYKNEDYFLWIRLLMAGFKGYNIQKVILKMRAGENMYKRRSGYKYFLAQKEIFRFMLDNRFISRSRYLMVMSIRLIMAMVPNFIRMKIYNNLLRKTL